MPETVSRETIRPLVVAKIVAIADPPQPPEDETRLFEDLRMGPTVRRAMSLPYTKISRRFGGKPITMSDAEDLGTVGDSVDLVHKRANGE